VEVWKVYSGLGPNHKYFFKTEGSAINFPNVLGPRRNLQQAQLASRKICGI
jgi:hypothetical protein